MLAQFRRLAAHLLTQPFSRYPAAARRPTRNRFRLDMEGLESRDCPATWLDTTGDHQFTTAANWSGDVVPGPTTDSDIVFKGAASGGSSDDVIGMSGSFFAIGLADDFTGRISLSGPVTAQYFEMHNGTIDQPGTTSTDPNTGQPVTDTAGTDLTIQQYFYWYGGTINSTLNPATLHLNATTESTIAPTNAGTVTLGSTLSVEAATLLTIYSGVVNVIGGTGINIDAASEVELAPDPAKAKVTIQATKTDAGYLINNFGHFLVEGHPGGEASSDIPIEIQSGILDVQDQATMTFKGQQYSFILGAQNPTPVGSIWANANSAQIRIGGGSTLSAQNGTTMSAGKLTADISGTLGGANDPNRTANLGGNLTVSGGLVGMAYGNIKATGANAHLTVLGNVSWSGGAFQASVDPGTGDCSQWTCTGNFTITNNPSLAVLPSDNTVAFAGPFDPIIANGPTSQITGIPDVDPAYRVFRTLGATHIEVSKP